MLKRIGFRINVENEKNDYKTIYLEGLDVLHFDLNEDNVSRNWVAMHIYLYEHKAIKEEKNM